MPPESMALPRKKLRKKMAHPGRPRKHDPKADDISHAITYSTTDEAIELIKQSDVNILDGEARTPLFHAVIEGKQDLFTWLLAHGLTSIIRTEMAGPPCILLYKKNGLSLPNPC